MTDVTDVGNLTENVVVVLPVKMVVAIEKRSASGVGAYIRKLVASDLGMVDTVATRGRKASSEDEKARKKAEQKAKAKALREENKRRIEAYKKQLESEADLLMKTAPKKVKSAK